MTEKGKPIEMTFRNELLQALSSRYLSVAEPGLSQVDLLHSKGKPSEALLYSTLFMPELIVVGDSVLLSWNVQNREAELRFLETSVTGSQSLEALESSFNFIEVGYLFVSRESTVEEDALLARLVCDAWTGWLKTSFPAREFRVEVLSEVETGSTVGVHFFEIR